MKYVIRYVKPHIPTMIFGFTIKFTGTILDLMIPYILSYIIDEVTPRNDSGWFLCIQPQFYYILP